MEDSDPSKIDFNGEGVQNVVEALLENSQLANNFDPEESDKLFPTPEMNKNYSVILQSRQDINPSLKDAKMYFTCYKSLINELDLNESFHEFKSSNYSQL
jgi:hypothetical protein